MKIAILTSGILPVPAVQGGAVENLIDFYLEYNERHRLHDITVFSVSHPAARKHEAILSTVNHYYFIDTSSIMARTKRKIRGWIKPKGDYYNNYIEFYFEQAYKALCNDNYDYIILENRPGYAKKLKERGFDGIVLHLHNDLLNEKTIYHQLIFDSLSCILTVSDYIKERVSTIGQSPKIMTVHNGINLSRFSHNTSASICRADIGFNPNDFVLVYSGRINKDKGISELIDAMLLLKDTPQIKLMVIGSTFFGNAANENDFVRALKNKAKAIEQQMIFTGFIAYDLMPDYLSLADAAIIPSIWDDPFPTTILEAQAMGLPIVCTKRGGIPEEITEQNAILISPDENFAERIATAILELYNHPQKRKMMAEASIKRSKLFDKEIYAKNFFNAIICPK